MRFAKPLRLRERLDLRLYDAGSRGFAFEAESGGSMVITHGRAEPEMTGRNPHAGEPFDTSDEDIAGALADVSIPTLMLSLVHMSGDPDLIRGRLRPAGLFLNEVQGYMCEEDKAEVRGLALDGHR